MRPDLSSLFFLAALLVTVKALSYNHDKGAGIGNISLDVHGDYLQTMTSLPFFPSIFAPTSEVVTNQLCRNDSLLFLSSLRNSTLWALKMLDGSAKFPTGLFAGVNHNMGNYGECLSLKASIPNNESPDRSFIGKYCLAKFEIPPSKLPPPTSDIWIQVKHSIDTVSEPSMNFLRWAICVPSTCSGEDLQSHLKYILPKLHQLKTLGIPVEDVDVAVDDSMCSTIEDNSGFTYGQTAVICIMIAVLILICLGSAVDTFSGKVDVVPKGYFTEVLLCFSIWRNLSKLTDCYQPAAALGPVPGVKFLSMTLIIFGHRVLLSILQASDNPRFLTEKYDDLDVSVVLSGNLLVDTFFIITGYLLSYHFILESGRIKSAWNIFWIYLHRYIRLTPVYMFVLAFISTLYIKMGSGPEWNISASLESIY
ncbi:nose resistant to fluoxetine protein 6-like [Ischnura elegans]|uniref:nose resistant to fluoxetine protein 6-like n=1 Tax=Ischnura elegans TaxID=197161 RepID=UPI001ED86B85|nr:nose resistant to fluoxetine protein 6-like [Ischnura elegans]